MGGSVVCPNLVLEGTGEPIGVEDADFPSPFVVVKGVETGIRYRSFNALFMKYN